MGKVNGEASAASMLFVLLCLSCEFSDDLKLSRRVARVLKRITRHKHHDVFIRYRQRPFGGFLVYVHIRHNIRNHAIISRETERDFVSYLDVLNELYLVPKRCVSIRAPYSDERREADRQRALSSRLQPPNRSICSKDET